MRTRPVGGVPTAPEGTRGLRGAPGDLEQMPEGIEVLGRVYPEASWQQCLVHFYGNAFTVAPRGEVKQVAAILKATHAHEDRSEVQANAAAVVAKAAQRVADGGEETATYDCFAREHRHRTRTNNPFGADHARDPSTKLRSRRLTGWPIGPDAAGGPASAFHRPAPGHPPLLGYGTLQVPGRDYGHNLSRFQTRRQW